MILCGSVIAQDGSAILFLGTPVRSEITDGTPKRFSLRLLAGQTAVVEADQAEMDVSLTSFDPAGNKLLTWGLPLGRVGAEKILIVAAEAGDYQVEVSTGNRHATSGKFVIKLTEIRETTNDDRIKNNAARAISDLMAEADRLRDDETAASYRKAVENWKRVVELSTVKQDTAAEARALHALGNLYFDFGEIQPALDVNLQAIELWRDLKNKRFELVASGRVANIWYQTGEYEKALAQFADLLTLSREIGSKTNEAAVLGNIGLNYLALDRPQTAVTYFEQALSIYADMTRSILHPQVVQNLGRAHIALGNYPKGIELLKNAVEAQEKSGFRIDSPPYYIVLGKAYQDTGETAKAYELFLTANKLANESGTLRYAVQSSYHLADIEYGKREFGKAVGRIESALALVEKTRGEIRSKDLRTSYFATVQDLYELYAELLVERSKGIKNAADVALAFEMSERSRARGLADLLKTARVDITHGIDPKLLREQQDLADELNNKYRILEELRSGKPKQEEIDKINAEINDLELNAESINVRIGQENPRYSELTNSRPLRAAQIQKLLDDDTVLLEYKLGKRRSFVWVVTNDSIEVFGLPAREEIEGKARSFYELIANGNGQSTKTSAWRAN